MDEEIYKRIHKIFTDTQEWPGGKELSTEDKMQIFVIEGFTEKDLIQYLANTYKE